MTTPKKHLILFAVDGSRSAEAALATALKMPWPASSNAGAVVAKSVGWLQSASEQALAVLESGFQAAATAARRVLSKRWPEAQVAIVDASPVDALLAEAKRVEATVIVLGWRGHGAFKRLLAGSVSRSIAERASCAVLIVREAPSVAIRRFVVAFDGCPNAERAVDFLSTLEPVRGSRVVLVNVVEPLSLPTSGARFPAAMRARLRAEVAAINETNHQKGLATVTTGAVRLERAGWKVETDVRSGAPLASLLKALGEHGGQVLVMGARATSGLDRALIGSVASGALNTAPVVLLVR